MCRSHASHLALYIVLIVALVGCSTTAPPPPYPVTVAPRVEPARFGGVPVEPARFNGVPVVAERPRPAPQAQNRYVLLDSATVQRLPNHRGGILGMKDATPIPVVRVLPT
jgi:hypothetical protein